MGANCMAEIASFGGFASSNWAVSCQHEYPGQIEHLRLTCRHRSEALWWGWFVYKLWGEITAVCRAKKTVHIPLQCLALWQGILQRIALIVALALFSEGSPIARYPSDISWERTI